MTDTPLLGYRVGVTAERRRDEIAALLGRRGAVVLQAPAIRLLPLVDDPLLRAATESCLADPPDDVVVTTGIGFRGWMEGADAWGLGADLRERLAATRLHARGPKATGAIRGAGLTEEWTAPSESTDEVIGHLVGRGVHGHRVALQLHGIPMPQHVAALEAAGARVLEVPVYRWEYPADLAPLDRLLAESAAGRLDAVTFTSALAVAAVLDRARHTGQLDALLAAFRRGRPWVCCVGEVTAAALVDLDVPVVTPPRARLGDLIRTVCVELPARSDVALRCVDHVIHVRRDGFLVNGSYVALAGTPMEILRELASAGGQVVPRRRLLALLPEADNDNALETAVARLRARLPRRDLVETVVKRGYRLAATA